MPSDPKYVRLADHMSGRQITDIAGGSGWTISGGDVQPFPKKPVQKRFVRQKLAQGILEPAGKAEYDEIQKSNKQFEDLVEKHGVQEGMIQDLVDKVRGEAGNDDEDDEEGDGGNA